MKTTLFCGWMPIALLPAAAATQDPLTLRVGHTQTPEDTQQELAAFKASYQDLEGWLQRRERIRAGILQALRLSPLPEKTPLNPRFGALRSYEAYTS